MNLLNASSDRLLRTVAAALPGGSVNVFDRNYRYVFAAGSGLDAAGLVPDALLGRTLRDVFGGDAAAVEPYYARAFAGDDVAFDLPVFDRIYAITASPMDEAMIIVLAQDVTTVRLELRRHEAAEAALEKANLQKDLFLATMLHELRQPLAPLRFGLDILKRGSDTPHSRTFGVMERQMAHLERLLLDLTELARGGPGELDVQLGQVDAIQLLHDTAQDSETLMQAQNHELKVEIAPAAAPLSGDAARLRQVFSNLLINAAKYTDPGGQIVLSAVVDDGWVAVSVRDNGRGIDPAALPRIFDLFVQEDTKVTGMGVGLHVVRQIVERHGGSVEGRSAGKGLGSEFVVHLPLATTIPVREQAPTLSTKRRAD